MTGWSYLKINLGWSIIYPDKYDIFNALNFTAYKDVKVVILGQDPYHGKAQAHGLSFSVKPGGLSNNFQLLLRPLRCFHKIGDV